MVRTTTDPLLKRLLPVIRQYRETLSKHTTLDREDGAGDIVWIKTKSNIRITTKWMEGVELFALFAHVDWELWKQEAKRIWAGSACDEWTNPTDHIGVDVKVNMSDSLLETQLLWLVKSSQASSQTVKFLVSRALIHEVLASRNKTVEQVPVRLSCSRFDDGLYRVMELILTQGRLARLGIGNKTSLQGGLSYNGLRVQYLRPVARARLDASSLQSLLAISTEGVVIDDMGLISCEVVRDFPHLVMDSIFQLMEIVGGNYGVARGHGVKHAAVDLTYPCSQLPGIYSAIRASRSLRHLSTVVTSGGKLQTAWMWLVYAVFSRPSGSQILESVSLDVSRLTCEGVRRMRDVLSAADPLALLAKRTSSLAGETISASRFWLVDPTSGSVEGTARTRFDSASVLEDLPVLNRSTVWTTVLLPGWGESWVHHADIQSSKRCESGPVPLKSVPDVTLTAVKIESKEAVEDLLRALCSGTRRLTIKPAESSTPMRFDRGFESILEVCPSLQSLEISGAWIDSFQFLLDAYTAGKCQLAAIKTTLRVTYGGTPLVVKLLDLVTSLTDSDHPVTRYLREVVIFPVVVKEILKPEVHCAIVTMLETNKRLAVFDVRYPWSSVTEDEREQCEQLSQRFDGETVSAFSAPLDIRQRLAFLSTLHRRERRSSRSKRVEHPMEKLGADVLSLIFKMAVSPRIRRVYIGPVSPFSS